MAHVVLTLVVMRNGEQDAQESISPSLVERDESTGEEDNRSRFVDVTRVWNLSEVQPNGFRRFDFIALRYREESTHLFRFSQLEVAIYAVRDRWGVIDLDWLVGSTTRSVVPHLGRRLGKHGAVEQLALHGMKVNG